MRNKLQNSVASKPFFSSRKINNIKSLNLALAIALFLLISGKGFAQLSESFDSGIPSAWTLFGNGVGTLDWSSTPDGYLGTEGVSINPSADNIGNGNTAQYFLVTPQIAVPANGEIQFYTKQASDIDNGAEYQIRISTAAQPDINGFNITIQSWTEADLNIGSQTSYEKKVVELPPSIPTGLNIYVAFVAVNTQNGATPTGDEWFVDEVSILEGCLEVLDEDVSIDSIGVDSAQVTWSHPTATNFEIQILPTGGVPADSGIPVTGTSITLSPLDAETEYDIYLSAICDNDTQSAFTGPYTFETLKFGLSCDDPIVLTDIATTPYILTDNLQNWVNPNISYTTEGTNCNTVGGSATTNYLNGDKVFLSYTPSVDGLITLTTTTTVLPGGGDNDENCFNDQTSLFVYEGCSNVGVNCIAGTNTTDPFEPSSINNLLVQGGQTYVIVLSSLLSSGAGICFELEISSPNCAPPADITYNNLVEDSVRFSWENIGDFADSWEYSVVPVGSGEPAGAGTPTNTNINALISGLTSDTTYDLYIRSVCNGSPGVWSNPYTFKTQCTTFNLPYSTDFANATNADPEPCWTSIDVNGDGISWSFIGGFATTVTSTNQNNNYDIYASPRVNFDATPKRIRYKHRATQGVSTYTIKLSTTGVGYDDFTTVVLPPTTINNTSFVERIVDLPEGITGEVNIAWIVEPNTTEDALRLSIDDIFIEDKPTCPDPLNPFVLQITTNSAWLFWTAGDAETQWEVAIQDLGSGIPTSPGILTTTNFPYIANDLESGNRYEFYVRAYCAADDQSNWVGPVAFTTLCESYDTPFNESFNDDDANTQKFCWKITDANNDNTTWSIDEDHAFLQTAANSPPSGFNDYLISPAINLDGNPKELKFKYRADFSFFSGFPRFGFEVLMSTTNSSPGSFSVISPLEIITNSAYEEKSIIVEGTGTVYFAIRVPPAFTGGWSILSIDDVSITDAPACPDPSNLLVDTVSTDSAVLSWTSGFQETAWNIAVQPAGSGIPSNTGIPVTTTNYSATGLLADTEYEFYVMADCGGDSSSWVGPVTFRTQCTPFTSPFVETFNSNSDTEACWTVINGNDDGETWELNSAVFPFEGDQAAVMFTGTNGQNDDWLISPTIAITENQRLRYYYRVNNSFFTEDLEVLLSTNGIGLDQFTTVLYDSDDDTILINNEEYRVKIINFPDGITGNINIAFHIPFAPPCSCSYRGQTLAIDNINIEDIPECPQPTNITLNNITDTAVQVAWDANGSETAWEISVQPSGTPAPIGDTDPEYLYSASTNPFNVTGLTASAAYDIYVRAVCSGDSEWTGPVEMTTQCNFENLCEYTFILTSNSNVSSTLDITQNNQVSQSLPFTGQDGEEFIVFLCSGVEFSVYFSTVGSFAPQYANYQFEIKNDQGVIVYTSPLGLPPRRTVYEGIAVCGEISCPQPTDLSVDETSTFSWSPGGSETQWEIAVQPLENGTIPQSGTVVSTPSYTPNAADFSDPFAATYEFFVRAICGSGDESYWSGPYEFVRNDDVSTALTLPINPTEDCNESGTNISFRNATASSETMSCDGINGGDIWFDFTAESLIQIIEVNNFEGALRDNNGDLPYPDIIMTLYKDNGGGNLEQVSCSYENLMVTMYSSELVVGDSYKLRLTLNSLEANDYLFNVCITTPEDLCLVDTVNGGFEEPVLERLSGITTIITSKVVPGWRQNFDNRNQIFIWETLNAPGFEAYEGGQCAQLIVDGDMEIDPSDPNVYGLFRDFDTSEITLYDFSYAHLARFDGNTVQIFAGPPGGPFTMINEHEGNAQAWNLVSGQYSVPNGQNITRFVFVAAGDDTIGNVIDAVSFLPNNEIITAPFEVDCNDDTATLEANGVGTWIPSDTNPGTVTFDDANSSTTTISGFLEPGTYTFTWKTRYCENSIELTYNGVADLPTVETPVQYCLNDTAQPLTATASGNYTLLWYTQAIGGTGSTTTPTPDTSVIGTTSYYVVNVDTSGCEGPRAEIEVIVSDAFTPELTFSYETTCIVAADNPTPTLSAGFATGGTFSSTTVTVDPTTGEIDMASASTGSHDVLYTYDGDTENCTLAGTFTATIEFTEAITPVTMFDYGSEPFCLLNGTTVLPNLDPGFTTGGEFSSTTLTVDATTGEIDLSSGAAGMHDVTYTVAADPDNCIEESSFTTTIDIVETIVPETSFTYDNTQYCLDSDPILPNLGTDFTTGGTFSAETGLSIDSTTGEITFSTSTAGNYTVTYEVEQDLNNCIEAASSTFSITLLEVTNPITTFDYGSEPFCSIASTSVLPNLATGFTIGGVFSSTTLTVDASTGEIDLTSAATGMHDIVYTFEGDPDNCISNGTFTTSIDVIQVTVTNSDFTYEDDVYCNDSPNVLPVLGTDFTSGGTFSAESGLNINATTGEITVSASTIGNYTVVYEISEDLENCIEGSISTFDLTILDSIEVAIQGDCNDSDYWLTASPVNNSFNPNEVTYIWMDANGTVVGDNTELFNVTEYANQNQNVTIPATFSVTVEFGSCSSSASFSTDLLSCNNIPRGISPDGNGKNDTFDLTGFGVTNLFIYNRYGREVYKFNGSYTNQWYGQTDNGKDLPDGTYYYSIKKDDGSSVTGWVFINRLQ